MDFKSPATGMFVQQLAQMNKNKISVLLALCVVKPPVTDGFPTQKTYNPKNISVMEWIHPYSVIHLPQILCIQPKSGQVVTELSEEVGFPPGIPLF